MKRHSLYWNGALGPDSIWRWHLTSIGNPIVEIRRSYDRLISTMGFPILVRCHLYIESGPRCHPNWYEIRVGEFLTTHRISVTFNSGINTCASWHHKQDTCTWLCSHKMCVSWTGHYGLAHYSDVTMGWHITVTSLWAGTLQWRHYGLAHYSDVTMGWRITVTSLWAGALQWRHITWASWRLKSSALPLLVQQLAQTNKEENVKAQYDWFWVMGIHQWPVDSHHEGTPMRKKSFHAMTSPRKKWL